MHTLTNRFLCIIESSRQTDCNFTINDKETESHTRQATKVCSHIVHKILIMETTLNMKIFFLSATSSQTHPWRPSFVHRLRINQFEKHIRMAVLKILPRIEV